MSLKPKEKPNLTVKQKRNRFKWATEHESWSQSAWNGVLFSDESKFQLTIGSQANRVIRRPDEEFHPACLKRTVKFPASVMVWGCMSAYGVGPLIFLHGTMNGNVYQNILRRRVVPTIRALRRNGADPTFQQDGATAHTCEANIEWLKVNDIPVLSWPSSSPDLSPIENLWGEMKKQLRKSNVSSKAELEAKISEIWRSFTPEYCLKLLETMPKRINAVKKRRGDVTQY